MKSLHLTLRLTQFHSGRKGFADGLSIDLASQTEVRAVTGLVGLMTTTVRLSTTAVDGSDGAAAKITHFHHPNADPGTGGFSQPPPHCQQRPAWTAELCCLSTQPTR